MSVIRTGGLQRKSLLFKIFTSIFAYFQHFTISSYVEQIEKLVFQAGIRIANIKTPKTMITCIFGTPCTIFENFLFT